MDQLYFVMQGFLCLAASLCSAHMSHCYPWFCNHPEPEPSIESPDRHSALAADCTLSHKLQMPCRDQQETFELADMDMPPMEPLLSSDGSAMRGLSAGRRSGNLSSDAEPLQPGISRL